jgi:hypothetical protein
MGSGARTKTEPQTSHVCKTDRNKEAGFWDEFIKI